MRSPATSLNTHGARGGGNGLPSIDRAARSPPSRAACPVLDPAPMNPRNVSGSPDRWVARAVVRLGEDPIVNVQPRRTRPARSAGGDPDAGDADGVVGDARRRPRRHHSLSARDRWAGTDGHPRCRKACRAPIDRALRPASRPTAGRLVSKIVGRNPERGEPDATSATRPMNPPPMTVTRAPSRARWLAGGRRATSARVRRRSAVLSPPWTGSTRGRAPVAIRQRSNADPGRRRPVPPLRASRSMRRDGPAVQDGHVPALVPPLRLGQDEVIGQFVPEQLLAQRRAVVRQRRLVADDQDPTVEALTPQRSGASDRCDSSPPMSRTSVVSADPATAPC